MSQKVQGCEPGKGCSTLNFSTIPHSRVRPLALLLVRQHPLPLSCCTRPGTSPQQCSRRAPPAPPLPASYSTWECGNMLMQKKLLRL
eukprot:scaffold77070_cov23-Tisochrysis_lutea.AAC.1